MNIENINIHRKKKSIIASQNDHSPVGYGCRFIACESLQQPLQPFSSSGRVVFVLFSTRIVQLFPITLDTNERH